MQVELKLLDPSEFPIVIEWVNAHDKDFIYQWAGSTYQYPLTLEQMKKHYSGGMNTLESGVFVYFIVDKEKGDKLGTLQLGRIDPVLKEAVMGRFLIKTDSFRGQGIGETALRQLVQIGFHELSLERLRLNVFHFNSQAIRCYEKVGFVKSAVRKGVYQASNGEWWDQIEMVLEKPRQ